MKRVVEKQKEDYWKITWPEFNAEIELYGGLGLIQADGDIDGREIYLRAKYEHFEFDIANENNVLPSDGGDGGYYKEIKVEEAGYSDFETIILFIEENLKRYKEESLTREPTE